LIVRLLTLLYQQRFHIAVIKVQQLTERQHSSNNRCAISAGRYQFQKRNLLRTPQPHYITGQQYSTSEMWWKRQRNFRKIGI